MDLLFDSFNPTGKTVHASLETVKDKQNKALEVFETLKAEKKEQDMNKAKGRKERRKLEKKLIKLKNRKIELAERSEKYKIRVSELEVEQKIARKKYEEIRLKDEKIMNEEYVKGKLLTEEVEQMRINLVDLQRQRIANLTDRIAPIIVYGQPSKRTTYKLQLKYLQYEIHPLSQRLRLTQMRVEQEQMKTRQMEHETRLLRDHISDLVNNVGVITKGLPMNKIILQDQTAKGKWKMLFSGVKATSMFGHLHEQPYTTSPSPDPTQQSTPEPELLF
jgi:hypothetical protein